MLLLYLLIYSALFFVVIIYYELDYAHGIQPFYNNTTSTNQYKDWTEDGIYSYDKSICDLKSSGCCFCSGSESVMYSLRVSILTEIALGGLKTEAVGW